MPMKFPEKFRWANAPHPYGTKEGDQFGLFRIIIAGRRSLKVMAVDSEETGWEHVSVSLLDEPRKCPSWDEMCLVKNSFWDAQDCVIQFHPPQKDYVNQHVGVLHLWRCVNTEFPMPPKECV